jgi:hypothetical protein
LESLKLRWHLISPLSSDNKSSFDISTIWTSLRDSGINLRDLDVDYMDAAVLDYLALSSGLETLRINDFSNPHRYRVTFPKDLAYRFFTAIMPRHAQSLMSLFILAAPQWCFNADYSSSLRSCEKLNSLSLSIPVSRDKGDDVFDLWDIVS